MTDRIDLAGIEVLAKHGVYPEEKERLQPFIVDVTAHLDLAPAGRSDDLADTLDYGALASEIEKVVASESHQLIERVAQRIAHSGRKHDQAGRDAIAVAEQHLLVLRACAHVHGAIEDHGHVRG